MLLCAFAAKGLATDLDSIGVTQLRALVPSLAGNDVAVAQPEAGSPTWEVNPSAVGQPTDLFTWTSLMRN